MQNNVKFRHELKYLCSSADLEILRIRLAAIMQADRHADVSGIYHIRSIYFDDLFNTSFHENESGISPREKWRIRAYNNSPNRIVLECKRKENGMTFKSSCPISISQFHQIIAGQPVPVSCNSPTVLNRFTVLQRERELRPVVIVGYDRRPFVCHLGNVRVTLDTEIFSSPNIESFFDNDIRRRPVLPYNKQLLEVKYDQYIPDHIFRSIQLKNMQLTTFSKYYLCRKYSL